MKEKQIFVSRLHGVMVRRACLECGRQLVPVVETDYKPGIYCFFAENEAFKEQRQRLIGNLSTVSVPPVLRRVRVTCRKNIPVLSLFMTYHRVCKQCSTTDDNGGAGTADPSESPEFTAGFQCDRIARSLVFYVVFCRSLFVIFLLVIVLSVFLRFMDSDYLPLVSSNSS